MSEETAMTQEEVDAYWRVFGQRKTEAANIIKLVEEAGFRLFSPIFSDIPNAYANKLIAMDKFGIFTKGQIGWIRHDRSEDLYLSMVAKVEKQKRQIEVYGKKHLPVMENFARELGDIWGQFMFAKLACGEEITEEFRFLPDN